MYLGLKKSLREIFVCTKHVWRTGRPPEGPQGASRGKYDGFIEVKHNFWLSQGGGHGGTSRRATTLERAAGKTLHFDLNHSNTEGFSRVS